VAPILFASIAEALASETSATPLFLTIIQSWANRLVRASALWFWQLNSNPMNGIQLKLKWFMLWPIWLNGLLEYLNSLPSPLVLTQFEFQCCIVSVSSFYSTGTVCSLRELHQLLQRVYKGIASPFLRFFVRWFQYPVYYLSLFLYFLSHFKRFVFARYHELKGAIADNNGIEKCKITVI